MPEPIEVKVRGTGPNDSVSLSGRSDEAIHLKFHGGDAITANATASVNAGGEIATHVDIGNTDSRPFAAVISGPGGAPLGASLKVGGTSEPIKLGPVALDLGRQRLNPDITITFKLFGITVCSIHVEGTTDLGPQP